MNTLRVRPYLNVYYEQDGKLLPNRENKIEYTDENGTLRVKTNPTYEDFAKVGKYPKKFMNKLPDYDIYKQRVIEKITLKDNAYEVLYVVENLVL